MNDLFIRELENEFGDSGYAFWFKTLELIASQGEKGCLEISLTEWRHVIHSRRTDHLRRLYTFAMAHRRLTVTEIDKEHVRVECKRFVEYADNYTKYDGLSTKRLQRHSKVSSKQEEEVEGEVEKKKNKDKTVSGKSAALGELTEGQKAKATLDWYCVRYQELLQEKYQCVGGRDMSYLASIFHTDKTITLDEMKKRLDRYLLDSDKFISGHGHALNHFKFNAYSETELAKRSNGNGASKPVTPSAIAKFGA